MNGLETMAADGTTIHTRLRAATRLLFLVAALTLSAGPARAQSDGAGAAGASGQGESADRSGKPDSGGLDGPDRPSLRRSDPAPPRQVRPAPSVTPSERILADSVVSFPVDI
jgi:hypothetical protein